MESGSKNEMKSIILNILVQIDHIIEYIIQNALVIVTESCSRTINTEGSEPEEYFEAPPSPPLYFVDPMYSMIRNKYPNNINGSITPISHIIFNSVILDPLHI